jgi:hypothetical protein
VDTHAQIVDALRGPAQIAGGRANERARHALDAEPETS